MHRIFISVLLLCGLFSGTRAQKTQEKVFDPELNIYVHKTEKESKRSLRYHPDQRDIVIENGRVKFNRALYGNHTGFRVETGDLPEFALYLPRMGGNLSFYIENNQIFKALNDADFIESRYGSGSRSYLIRDSIFHGGILKITVLAMSDKDGMIVCLEADHLPANLKLGWRFGGASDKRFSREGDLGVDPPDCFDLKPEYCIGNQYELEGNTFKLRFAKDHAKMLRGVFPEGSVNAVTDWKLEAIRLAKDQGLPNSKTKKINRNSGNDLERPVFEGKVKLAKKFYLAIYSSAESLNEKSSGSDIISSDSHKKSSQNSVLLQDGESKKVLLYSDLPALFEKSRLAAEKISNKLIISTPDPYINTLGGVFSSAADGIWDGKVWLHGAVGWRMPLSGWRAAYAGDVLGWHDRSRIHFNAYAKSQVKDITPVFLHPYQDSALNMARAAKAWGTQMYSNGYICRNPERNDQMHHYDMNLAYMDELLWHLQWTGDKNFAGEIWPVIKSSLAWEKRNFDPDKDGLYDAYCCIWASDALYYNSGGVTHSSAYNYRANLLAARLAFILGDDPEPYKEEANRIKNAVNRELWIPGKGVWAEFKDKMGKGMRHENPALWTIYHAIDAGLGTPLQSFQSAVYIENEIPRFKLEIKDEKQNDSNNSNLPNYPRDYHVYSTSSWMPYSWSINNVVVAENYHSTLAFWEAGIYEEANILFKSIILDNMFMGQSPGNVGQISYYDAARGECYRDFGDPVGIGSRALVQGLFGIRPDLLNGKLKIKPGFPANWDHAMFSNGSVSLSFKRVGMTDNYILDQNFKDLDSVEFELPLLYDKLPEVIVNGVRVKAIFDSSSPGGAFMKIKVFSHSRLDLDIHHQGNPLPEFPLKEMHGTFSSFPESENVKLSRFPEKEIHAGDKLTCTMNAVIDSVLDPQSLLTNIHLDHQNLNATVKNESGRHVFFVKLHQGEISWLAPVFLNISNSGNVQKEETVFREENKVEIGTVRDSRDVKFEMLDIRSYCNDSLTCLFKNKYLSPRSPYTTLQIPVQGIGEWCHPKMTSYLDDSGIRKSPVRAAGVDFKTVSEGQNAVMVSLWDNYPDNVTLPLSGKASRICLMMAGTTNHMQYKLDNAWIIVRYKDQTTDTLKLVNPFNWYPIEQDLYVDGKAFRINEPADQIDSQGQPCFRIQLSTGLTSRYLGDILGIEGVYGRQIPGGAGVLLDMKLDPFKTLESVRLEARANEIIAGILAITLLRL